MPPANKTKLQQPKLALSKHVKKHSSSSDLPTAILPSANVAFSGIPQRSKTAVVLTDELLSKIKKGLESSVGSKSKVKVKRLSGAMKQQKSKATPAKVSQRKKSAQVIDIDDSLAHREVPKKIESVAATLVEKKSEQNVTTKEDVDDSLLKTPNLTQIRFTKGKTNTMSSPKSSLKSSQNSPSNNYNLRSRPEMPVSAMLPPASASKPLAKNNRTKKSDSSPGIHSLSGSTVKKATSAKTADKKRKSSDSASSDSHSISKVPKSWTEIKSKTSEKSKRFLEVAIDFEKLETPRQAVRKRKFDMSFDAEHQSSSNKRNSVGKLSATNLWPEKDQSDKKLLVKVTRLELSVGNSGQSLVSNNAIFYNLPTNKMDQSERDVHSDIHSFKNTEPVYKTTFDQLLSTEDELDFITSTSETVSDDLVSNMAKQNNSVHWNSSLVKAHLIEKVNSKKRLTRSSFYSNFGVDSSQNTLPVVSRVNRSPPRSIMKPVNVVDKTDELISLTDTSGQSRRKLCVRLCEYILLVSLPVAAAVYYLLALN